MDKARILAMATDDFNAEIVGFNQQRIHEIAWPASQSNGMVIELPWCDASDATGALEFLVAMGSLNFRFWKVSTDGRLTRYQRYSKTGARALWEAFEENWGGSAMAFHERLQGGMLGIATVFGDIPHALQCLEILFQVLKPARLHEVCRDLTADITQSCSVTVKHAHALELAFPLAFADPYLKKAQLALSMFAGFLRHGGWDIDTSGLVAFADYQVPRVLRSLGVLHYSPALAVAVDSGTLIEQDSAQEKAIRAATILACERIADATGGTSAAVDNWLWQSQDFAANSRFHLTPTTRY